MRRKGFTLIEMVLVTAIIGVVLSAFSSVLISQAKAFNKTKEYANLENESLIIARLISNEIKGCSSVEIAPTKPSDLDADASYIYYNADDNIIYIKKGIQAEEVLFNSEGVKQKVTFAKIDNKNLSVGIVLEKQNIFFKNFFGLNLINATDTSGVFGEEGAFISFKYGEANPLITSFNFDTTDNANLSENSYGTINQSTGEITLDVSDSDVTKLVPSIEIVGDTLRVGSELGQEVDVNSKVSMDFTNPVDFYVFIGENVKKYTVTVNPPETEMPDILLDPALGIIATEKGDDPLDVKNVIMPNKENVLNAIYEFEEEPKGFVVKWYAVPQDEIDTYNDFLNIYKNVNGKNVEDYLVCSVKDSNVLDVSKYDDEIAGKYVFYAVAPTDGVNYNIDKSRFVTSLAESVLDKDGKIDGSDPTKPSTVVFVGFKNGKIFETTMNEIDYLYSSEMKKNVILQEFNKMSGTRKSNYAKKSINTDDKISVNNLDSFMKVKVPIYNTGHTYTVDFVKREMVVTGSTIQWGRTGGNYMNGNDAPLGGSQYGQYGLFSVNMFDDFYTDKRVDTLNSGVRVGFKNGIDDDMPEIGGIAVAPNVTSTLHNNPYYSGDYFNGKILKNQGYYVNFMYSKSDDPENINSNENADKSVFNRGVNMNWSVGDYINGNFNQFDISQDGKMVGAKIKTERHGNDRDAITPYLLSEIEKDDYSIERGEPNNLIMDIDIDVKRGSYSSYPLYTVNLTNANNQNQKTQTMYFGYYKDVLGKSSDIYTIDSGNKETEIYTAVENGQNVSMDYNNVVPKNNANYETSVCIWGYNVTDKNAKVTITEFTSRN